MIASNRPFAWRTPGMRLHRLAAAMAILLLPAACVVAGTGDSGGTDVVETFSPGRTLMGNYLAGRHAQAAYDLPRAADYLDAALAIDPEAPNLMRRTFVMTTMNGRMDRAMELARDFVAIDPKAPFANLAVVIDDIKAGRFAEAEARLGGQEIAGLNIFMVPLLKAWVKVGLGEGAEAALEALAPLNGNERFKALSQLHGALINDFSGHMEAAEKGYLAATEIQGGLSLRLVELIGTFHERIGQPEKAMDLYRTFLDANPGTPLLDPALARLESGRAPAPEVASAVDGVAEGLFEIAGSLNQQNARETALMFGRLALYLRPDFPVLQALVGNMLETDGRLEEANALYGAIDKDSPYSWSTRLRIADNLDDLERPAEAEEHLRAMAADHPGKAEPVIRLGDLLRRRERHSEAIEAYDLAQARIGKLEPQHWILFYSRGISLEQSKQWPRAEADFLQALEFEPDQPYVLNYLGYSWVDQGINLERAQEMIRKAVELRPTDGYIVDSMGWAYYRLGEFEKAVVEMERAVELRPEDPVINDHLGDVYWRVGRRQEARFQWRRALTLDPEPDLVETARAKLENGLAEEAKVIGDD